MEFLLFSQIPFRISNTVTLIESYCFQSNFYANYDLNRNRKVEDVNKIGARINKNLFPECKRVTEKTKNLRIFTYQKLDEFLESPRKDDIIEEFNEIVG